MVDLYAVSVPVLVRYLGRLDGMLQQLTNFAAEQGENEEQLLATALAEDMFDLRHQILIATNFSIRTLRPLVPALAAIGPAEGRSIAELRARIAERIEALRAIDPRVLDGEETRIVSEEAGHGVVETDALTFVTQYALPNFFFHLMAAYSILRRIGVPVGKADFDGFHAYPPGFRFV